MNLLAVILLLFSSPSEALTKVKLGLNWKAEPEFGGFYEAKIKKFYEKAGLDVEIIEGAANIPIAQMISSGQVEFGISSGDHVLLSRSNGSKVRAIFSVYQKSPQCVMVRESSPIKTMKDLMDSDYTLAAGAGVSWLSFLQKKYNPRHLKVVPYQGGVSAYLNNEKLAQQGFAGSEPQLAEANGVKTRTLLIADDGFDNFAAVVVTTDAYLEKNKDKVRAFVEASRLGWESYIKNPRDTHQLIASLNSSMGQGNADKILKVQKVLMMPAKKDAFGTMSLKRWEKLTEQMLDLGLIRKHIKASDLFLQL